MHVMYMFISCMRLIDRHMLPQNNCMFYIVIIGDHLYKVKVYKFNQTLSKKQ